MNERILELADKAVEDIHSGPWNISDEFCIKFAQLIVQECIEVIDNTSDNTKLMRVDPYQKIIMAIEEHFGAESTSIKVGSRVKVVSGFNVGAKGTVSYIEPTGRMWVMRDGASTDVFYTPDEVVRIEE